MRRPLLYIFILILSMNSLLYAKKNPAKLLQQNNNLWQEFRWQGIIQVQSSAFAIRKNFVFSRNSEAIRLDILDSGILGLNAQPLITIYIKDKIVLNAPSVKQLEGIDPNWFFSGQSIKSWVNFTDSLQTKQQEIVSHRKAVSGKTVYSYDNKYRLIKVKSNELNFEAVITYNRRNKPSKIALAYLGNPLAEMQIIESKYDNIEITPLVLSVTSDDESIPNQPEVME